MMPDNESHPVFKALRDGKPIFGGTVDRGTMRSFVLEHGKIFTPAKLPKGIRRRKPGTCFASCARFVLNHPEHSAGSFRYVEGFAMRPSLRRLVPHAWIACDGQAFDLTWQDLSGGDNLDCLYFGVEFPTVALAKILVERRYYRLLDPVDDLVRAAFMQASEPHQQAA